MAPTLKPHKIETLERRLPILISILCVSALFGVGLYSSFAATVSPVFQAGSVGTSMSVPVNPINSSVLQLRERAAELEREQDALEERARQLASWEERRNTALAGSVIASIFLAVVLIVHLYRDRRVLTIATKAAFPH